MIKTEFGNVSLNNYGYYQIISEKEGNKNKSLHRVIFEEFYNIKIPKGYEIHHIDGNSLNNDIRNLQCVTKEKHLSFHKSGKKHHNYNNYKKIPRIRKRGIGVNNKQRYNIAFKSKHIYESTDYEKICNYYQAIIFNLKYNFI